MTKLSKEKAVYFHKFSIYFRMFGMRRKQIQIATIETNISLQNPLKNGKIWKIHDVTYGDITSPPFVNRVQSTFCQSSPVHLLSIESSPPFVNRVQSTFCQSSPVHLLSIESSPPFVNRVQSTFCQSSPVHLLSIESSPPFVNRVQSTFCQSSPVHVLSYALRAGVARSGQPIRTLNDKFSLVKKHRSSNQRP